MSGLQDKGRGSILIDLDAWRTSIGRDPADDLIQPVSGGIAGNPWHRVQFAAGSDPMKSAGADAVPPRAGSSRRRRWRSLLFSLRGRWWLPNLRILHQTTLVHSLVRLFKAGSLEPNRCGAVVDGVR